MGRGGLGSQTSHGKNIKAALSLSSFLFFFVSNRPWAAQNQAAHVAIVKTPQRPVRLWLWGSTHKFMIMNLTQGVEFNPQIYDHGYDTRDGSGGSPNNLWSSILHSGIEVGFTPQIYDYGLESGI